MRFAVKLAYDGARFHGSQRARGPRTVEGDLVDAMRSLGMIADREGAGLRFASRTDRGVSALGNVFAFSTDFRPEAILPALNSRLSDIWCWALARVPDDFDPRGARSRWYRYHLPGSHDVRALRGAARLFVGRHDFRSFSKRVEGDTVRTLDSIVIRKEGGLVTLDFRAQGFLWNMVRRVVSGMLGLESGKVKPQDIREALKGRVRRDFGLAPPEPLVLMDVSYDLRFRKSPKVIERLGETFEMRLWELRLKQKFFEMADRKLGHRK